GQIRVESWKNCGLQIAECGISGLQIVRQKNGRGYFFAIRIPQSAIRNSSPQFQMSPSCTALPVQVPRVFSQPACTTQAPLAIPLFYPVIAATKSSGWA